MPSSPPVRIIVSRGQDGAPPGNLRRKPVPDPQGVAEVTLLVSAYQDLLETKIWPTSRAAWAPAAASVGVATGHHRVKGKHLAPRAQERREARNSCSGGWRKRERPAVDGLDGYRARPGAVPPTAPGRAIRSPVRSPAVRTWSNSQINAKPPDSQLSHIRREEPSADGSTGFLGRALPSAARMVERSDRERDGVAGHLRGARGRTGQAGAVTRGLPAR